MLIIDILNGLAIGSAGLTLPTIAMWRLNRTANGMARGSRKEAVYALKNAFVKMLYERGLCVKVTREDQVKECWHTRAYNDGWEDYCPKCDNTGIYSRYPLYRFVFVVDGTAYVWHQPVVMVDWPVQVNFGKEADWHGQAQGHRYPKSIIREDAWTVWWCLLLHGYRVSPPLRLYKLRLSPTSFKPYWGRADPIYYRRPFSAYLPFLFVHLSGDGQLGNLRWQLKWPWVQQRPMQAWSPKWLSVSWREGRLSIGSKWIRDRLWRLRYAEEEIPF